VLRFALHGAEHEQNHHTKRKNEQVTFITALLSFAQLHGSLWASRDNAAGQHDSPLSADELTGELGGRTWRIKSSCAACKTCCGPTFRNSSTLCCSVVPAAFTCFSHSEMAPLSSGFRCTKKDRKSLPKSSWLVSKSISSCLSQQEPAPASSQRFLFSLIRFLLPQAHRKGGCLAGKLAERSALASFLPLDRQS